MAAKNTDRILYVSPNTGWQLDSSGIPDATVDNFGLVNAALLPTASAVLVTIDRVNSSGVKTPGNMERIVGVVSGNRLINCIRGVGGTARQHAGGAVVEVVISAENFNKYVDGFLEEHTQIGLHKGPKAVTLTPSAGATQSIDLDAANRHRITMPAGNITLSVANDAADRFFLVEIKQDATGGRTVTWFSTIQWADGIVPVLSTGANKKDLFGFVSNGDGTFTGVIIAQNI